MRGSATELERKILDFMVAYLRENTYQPSIREIGEKFGIKSTKTVSEHLQSLATKGFLERDPSRSRGVKILGMDLRTRAVSVPCYDAVPAGLSSRPIKTDTYVALDRRLVGEHGAFCVRVDGSELADLGARDGDLALLEPIDGSDVKVGEIVAASLPGLGRFLRVSSNGRGLSVTPVGSNESTHIEDADLLGVVGRVVGVMPGLQVEQSDRPFVFGAPAH